jgi:hypothetical protein
MQKSEYALDNNVERQLKIIIEEQKKKNRSFGVVYQWNQETNILIFTLVPTSEKNLIELLET